MADIDILATMMMIIVGKDRYSSKTICTTRFILDSVLIFLCAILFLVLLLAILVSRFLFDKLLTTKRKSLPTALNLW